MVIVVMTLMVPLMNEPILYMTFLSDNDLRNSRPGTSLFTLRELHSLSLRKVVPKSLVEIGILHKFTTYSCIQGFHVFLLLNNFLIPLIIVCKEFRQRVGQLFELTDGLNASLFYPSRQVVLKV